jgi:hypothetical protein
MDADKICSTTSFLVECDYGSAVRSVLDPLVDPGNVFYPDPVDPKCSGLLDPDPDMDPFYLIRLEKISENKFRNL